MVVAVAGLITMSMSYVPVTLSSPSPRFRVTSVIDAGQTIACLLALREQTEVPVSLMVAVSSLTKNPPPA